MLDAMTFLWRGGLLMLPIGFCSIAALAITIERTFALRRSKVLQPQVLDMVKAYEGEGSAKPVLEACMRSGGAFARIIEEILHVSNLDHAQVLETIHATGRREVGRLERGLIILEIVAGVSPLLGLLGTVLGMLTVFDAITAEGIGDPQVLSAGISKALVTTVAGLSVAIPALAFHSYFSNQVESFAAEMQELATGFSVRLQSAGRAK